MEIILTSLGLLYMGMLTFCLYVVLIRHMRLDYRANAVFKEYGEVTVSKSKTRFKRFDDWFKLSNYLQLYLLEQVWLSFVWPIHAYRYYKDRTYFDIRLSPAYEKKSKEKSGGAKPPDSKILEPSTQSQ